MAGHDPNEVTDWMEEGIFAMTGKTIPTVILREKEPEPKPAEEKPEEFICHDYCGWEGQFGRFTHLPSSKTLTCRAGWVS